MGTAIGDDFKLQNSNGKGNRQRWVVLESLFKNRAGSRRSSRPKAQVYMCVCVCICVCVHTQLYIDVYRIYGVCVYQFRNFQLRSEYR